MTIDKILKFFFINFLLSLIFFFFYIFLTPEVNKLLGIIALVSNTAIIYIVLFVVLLILYFIFRKLKIFPVILILSFVILHTLNVADILIYHFFKYHINGLVINVVITPGGIEALDIPASNYAYFAIFILFLLFLEIFLYNYVKKSKVEKYRYGYIIALLMAFIISDKMIYAYLDSQANVAVRQIAKLYPLYMPFTCKKLLRKVFHIHVAKEYKLKLNHSVKTLNYPLKPLNLEKRKQYPNIIWILLDAWRRDAFNKELTPNIYKFSKKALVFTNHRSGGIATRFGVFSLFYGLYGTYWHKFLVDKRSPLFLDILQKLNYNFKILASTKFTYPEFDQTVFIHLNKYLPKKLPPGNIAHKDLAITENLINWLKKQDNATNPFFSFIFLDAPHAKSFLPQFNKYRAKKGTNYLIVGKKNITVLKNRYLNAVLTDDFCVSKLLDFLEKRGFLKNTIVLISADHGEEFYEHGHVGHTSAFTPEQNNVPMILYIPGKKHKVYSRLTIHYDIVPTIMPFLGVTTSAKYYSNGLDMLGKKEHRFVVASSWTNFAVIYNDYRFIFSLASYKAGLFNIKDNDFKDVKDRSIFQKRIKDFTNVLREMSKF